MLVECRTPEREVRGSRPTAAVLCPWARHFTPRKYWLNTQEAMAPSRHEWKIVDWDVKPQHNQPTKSLDSVMPIVASSKIPKLWPTSIYNWSGRFQSYLVTNLQRQCWSSPVTDDKLFFFVTYFQMCSVNVPAWICSETGCQTGR